MQLGARREHPFIHFALDTIDYRHKGVADYLAVTFYPRRVR
jgi:hypothetical protein